MKKTCVIMQPHYLPWLGYFELINNSDVFVFLDHVQFEPRSWQHRNRIISNSGEIMTLSLPASSSREMAIHEVKIAYDQKPILKHLSTIRMNYSKHAFFNQIYPELEELFLERPIHLEELNSNIILWGMKNWSIESEIIYSRDLNVIGNKVIALIDICKKVNANHYYSALGSKVYIDANNIFEGNNIDLEFQNFNHPIYHQSSKFEFVSHLSFVDYVMRFGFNDRPF